MKDIECDVKGSEVVCEVNKEIDSNVDRLIFTGEGLRNFKTLQSFFDRRASYDFDERSEEWSVSLSGDKRKPKPVKGSESLREQFGNRR